MLKGELFWIKRTGARVEVEEVDGQRAIARGVRNGGRLMVFDDAAGCYVRSVVDNGASGASLFASLDPVGPRYAARSMGR
jgi:hypothetical protein